MPKVTQTLDKFPPIDFEVFDYVLKHGRFTAKFETAKQCTAIKFRFLRLRDSLAKFQPDTPLQKASALFSIRANGDILLITTKLEESESRSLRSALNDQTQFATISTDFEEELNLQAKSFDQMTTAEQDAYLKAEEEKWLKSGMAPSLPEMK